MNDPFSAYQNRRVIVFGPTGFIGRWVARFLSQQKAELYLVFRDPDSTSTLFPRYGIKGHSIRLDLSDLDRIRPVIEDIRPDVVFNLAGYGVDRSERDEKLAYSLNADLVERICITLDKIPGTDWPGQRLIHAGSALEYGEIQGDLHENSQPFPTTLYGKSKLAGTKKLKIFSQTQQLSAITARLFTVYGPGEHSGRLLPSLLEIAATGKTLSLTAGLQKRDFSYVEDVAEGLLRLGLGSAFPGEIVNLATGKLHSVREFVEIAGKALSIQPGQLKFGALPTRSYEMEHSPVSIEKLRLVNILVSCHYNRSRNT